MKNRAVFFMSFTALFAAIICIGCFIKIPLGVIPIVLQNVLCVLTGALLGGFAGAAPTAVFLVAGLLGLPVYSGGTSGLAVWLGPTGGFLPGYLLGALVAGLIAGKPGVEEKKITAARVVRLTLGIIAGMIVLYIPGVIRFAYWAGAAGKVPANKTALAYTMAACVLPFIPGDLIKIVVAVPVALRLRPVVAQYLYSDPSSFGGTE
ncbi:MAG: biotin transporter BioY [Treponema sp.]|nr:biotin transporter BioY [Treponema sp.]MBO4534144.1 biotin transporter BioY [Treponema sp.]